MTDYEELCKVNDVLFKIKKDGTICPIKIIKIEHYPHPVYRDNFRNSYFNKNIFKNCFKTKEEAKKEIQRRQNIVKKRQLLKEYERRLNKELGLEDHYYIR